MVVPAKINFLSRVTPPDTMRAPAGRLDAAVEDVTYKIMAFRPPPGFNATLPGKLANERMHLGLRHGGLGIAATERVVDAAYCGSIALVGELLVKRGFLSLGGTPFAPDRVASLFPALPAALARLNLAPPLPQELQDLTVESLFETSRPKMQSAFMKNLTDGDKGKIVALIDDKQERAMFLSMSSTEGGAIMTANPAAQGCKVTNVVWSTAMRARLGLDTIATPSLVCPEATGPKPFTQKGYHALTCRQSPLIGMRTGRHEDVQAALEVSLRIAGKPEFGNFTIQRGPNVTTDVGWQARVAGTHALDRADILLTPRGDPSGYMAIDLRIAIPSVQLYPNAHEQAGLAAEAGRVEKEKLYARRFVVPQGRFLPFIVEAGGRFSPQTLQWLKDIHRRSFKDDKAYSFNFRRCLERIQVALWSNVARSMTKLGTLAASWPAPAAGTDGAPPPVNGDAFADEDDAPDGPALAAHAGLVA